MGSLEISITYAHGRRQLCVPKQFLNFHTHYYLSNLPGAKRSSDAVLLPLEPRVFELAFSLCSSKALAPDVERWYSEIQAREQVAIALKHRRDISILYPTETTKASPAHNLYPFQRVGVAFLHKVRRALLCDELGMGKCLGAGTLVQFSDGRSIPIEEIVPGQEVLGYNIGRGRLEPVCVLDTYTRGELPAVRVVTRSGRAVVCSLRHRFLMFPDKWVEARDLKVGDRIGAARRLPDTPDDPAISDAELSLLGWLIAEGSITTSAVTVHNNSEDVLADIHKATRELGFEAVPMKGKGCKGFRLNGAQRWLRSWGLLGKSSYTKAVPQELFCCSKRQLSLFLSRLFRGDGCFFFNGRSRLPAFEYSSMSEALCRDVQRLLLRFGVLSVVKKASQKGRHGHAWRTAVYASRYVRALVDEIGQFGKPLGALKERLCHTRSCGSRLDAIPATYRELLLHPPGVITSTLGRTDKMWYYGKAPTRTRELVKRIAVADGNEPLLAIADGDAFWDEILAIEPLGARAMYDLEVGGADHSFLSENLITHNTATAIVAIDSANRASRTLVLCPNSLKAFWVGEIQRWTQVEQPITVVNAATRDLDLLEYKTRRGWLVMNWELLRLTTKELKQYRWDWILADEAHRAKNRKTQLWKAFKRLQADHLIMITGTPFANDPSELWAPLNLLYPDRFPSYWRFYEMYVDYTVSYLGFREVEGVRNADILRNELRPIMLRRPKKEFLKELPDKTYKVIPVPLSPRQAGMYRQMAREMLVELEGGEALEAVNAISMITRLRQITSTTATLENTDQSSKLDAVIDMIQDTDEKLVVFSQFRETVHALSRRLTKVEVPHVIALGGMGPGVNEAVQAFQSDPRCRVFVATAQTGGVGITLTAARTVVFVDVHWNPAMQTQAEDRIHRIGQKEACLVVTLHCPHTVDDLVRRILDRKTKMIEEVLLKELVGSLHDFQEVYG